MPELQLTSVAADFTLENSFYTVSPSNTNPLYVVCRMQGSYGTWTFTGNESMPWNADTATWQSALDQAYGVGTTVGSHPAPDLWTVQFMDSQWYDFGPRNVDSDASIVSGVVTLSSANPLHFIVREAPGRHPLGLARQRRLETTRLRGDDFLVRAGVGRSIHVRPGIRFRGGRGVAVAGDTRLRRAVRLRSVRPTAGWRGRPPRRLRVSRFTSPTSRRPTTQ